MIRSSFLVLALSCFAVGLRAQNVASPDTPEPGSVEEISKATSEPHFLSPWVSYLPASSTVPSPRAFFGFAYGEDADAGGSGG